MAKAGYEHEKLNGLGKLILEASGKREHQVSKAKGFNVTSEGWNWIHSIISYSFSHSKS